MMPWQRLQSNEEHDPLSLFDDSYDDLDDEIVEAQESSEEDESPESGNDLAQENTFLSSYLLRHWHYTDFVNRFGLSGIKHKSATPSESADDKTPTRLFWLTGAGILLENWSKIRLAHFIKDFFDSSRFMIGIEAIVLAGLLLHDLISYGVFPEERCGIAFPDILDGMTNNQITWTNHFGSDVIHEFAYWTWLGAVLFPPMTGLIVAFLQDRQRESIRCLEADDVINKVDADLNVLDKELLTFKDACISLIPFTAFSKTLAQLKFMVLWDGRKNADQSLLISLHLKNALVGNLIELAHPSSYFFIRYQALRLLAEIAASFHPKNLDRFIEDPVHKAGLLEIRETILKALREEPMSEARTSRSIAAIETMCAEPIQFHEEMDDPFLQEDRKRGGLARYFRWTLGEDIRPLTQLFWIPSLLVSAYTFYSASRYLELIVLKLMDIINHFHDKSVCENNGNYFNFLTQSERYECVACDWSFVNYQNSSTAQACLQVLLQQTMTPVEILSHLTQLPAAYGITRIDLAQQDWPNWPVSIWEQFLTTLQSMVTSPLELLNVSGPPKNDVYEEPSQQHIQALAQFLTGINVTRFDISNKWLNDELFNLLVGPLAESAVEELNLVNTNLTDVSATSLANLISEDLYNLNNLQLAGNQITDLGIQHISEALSNSSLIILNLANNPFTDLGLQKLADGIQQSFVHTIDLSGQQFSVNGLKFFSDTLKGNSSLSVLKLSNAGLKSDHITALQNCLENLESLDVSANLLTGKDVQWILKTNQQSLKTLSVAENDLRQEAGALIAQELSMSSLQHLDLSGNALRQGFKQLVRALPGSQLLSLSCEKCELKDEAVAELTEIYANNTLLLRSLNLNNNKLTVIPLINWLAELPQTNLRELHLNSNQISNSNESAPLLAEGLSKTNLTVLDLSNNLLDGNFFNALAPILHQSQLQQLSLNDNKLEATSLKYFAEALPQLPCHSHDLNTTQLSRQMKRVFYPMQPATELKQLDIVNTDSDSSTLRSFCRIAASLPDIRFLEYDRIQQLDWRTCDMMPTNTLPVVQLNQTHASQSNQTQSMPRSALVLGSPFLMSLLCAGGILCVIALLYGAYRASRSTYRFFRPAPLQLAHASAESEEVVTNHNLRRSSP